MTLAIVTIAVVVLSVLAGYGNWIAGRHERLASRADSAWAALDAQLVRRAAAARVLGASCGDDALAKAAADAIAGGPHREAVENTLGRELRRAGTDDVPPDDPAYRELREAAGRVHLARQFHNDAVRDLRAIRRRRTARLLRLGRGDATGPGRAFFEIDDTVARGAAPPTVVTDDPVA
jgi:hypothetical protein